MNVRLYARVSHDEQVKFGYSIEAQISSLQSYCKERDYNIMGTYIDEGISAYSIDKRHEFKRMITESKANEIILFTKLDRFSRNILDANMILLELKKKNVSIKAINEDDIDTTTADGKFLFDLKLSLAERERNKTSERINDVFKYKALKGESISGKVPFGYKVVNKRYEKDDEKADAVIQLFKYYDQWQNMTKTTRWWNNTFEWKKEYRSIQNMLKNKIYIGEHKYNVSFCDGIVDSPLFYRVQEKIKNNTRERKNKNVFLFAGLIKCPLCGRIMSGNAQTRRYKDKVHKYYVYRCNHAYSNHLCSNRHILVESRIERFLLDNLNDLASATIQAEKKSRKVDHSKEIAKIKTKITKLKDLYLDDLISKTDYEKDYRELTSRLHELTVISSNKPSVSANMLKGINITKLYEKMDRETKQAFWKGIIRSIIVEDDIKVEFL